MGDAHDLPERPGTGASPNALRRGPSQQLRAAPRARAASARVHAAHLGDTRRGDRSARGGEPERQRRKRDRRRRLGRVARGAGRYPGDVHLPGLSGPGSRGDLRRVARQHLLRQRQRGRHRDHDALADLPDHDPPGHGRVARSTGHGGQRAFAVRPDRSTPALPVAVRSGQRGRRGSVRVRRRRERRGLRHGPPPRRNARRLALERDRGVRRPERRRARRHGRRQPHLGRPARQALGKRGRRSSRTRTAMDITRTAIERNRVTFLALLVIAFSGFSAYRNLPKDEDPGFIIRTALITTIFPGASPGARRRTRHGQDRGSRPGDPGAGLGEQRIARRRVVGLRQHPREREGDAADLGQPAPQGGARRAGAAGQRHRTLGQRRVRGRLRDPARDSRGTASATPS